MLIQAEDKRLSPHEESGAAWRKNRFTQGYKCHVGGRREERGKGRESKRCADKERKWREQTERPGIFNELNEVIISKDLIPQPSGGAGGAEERNHVYYL